MLTTDILKKYEEKNNLLKLIKDESDPALLATLRQQYKKNRNSITNEKRANKKAYFAKRFMENKDNSLKIWKEIKSLVKVLLHLSYLFFVFKIAIVYFQ